MTNAQLESTTGGGGDKDLLLSVPEISVWMTAFGCLRSVDEYLVEWRGDRITEKQYFKSINACLVNLAETADATHRFGVLLPSTIEPHYRKHMRELDDAFLKVDFSPSFWRWYNWWSDYINTLKAYERKHVYHLAMERLRGLEAYRPAGDWLHHRSNPVLVLSTN